MKAYQTARGVAEGHLAHSGLPATILRPFYVLGPGHRWPMALIPIYALLERLPGTRSTALRLGLVTITQMVAALVWAVEFPPETTRFFTVPDIRKARL
jgi:nucleoside-diphosphate-sugar epimerase